MKYSIVLILLLFSSCKKDEININYPSVYHSVKYILTDNPKIYSVNGEITTQALIDEFRNTYRFEFGPDGILDDPPFADTIRLISETEGSIYMRFTNFLYTTSKNQETILFKSTSTGTTSLSENPFTNPRFDALKYKPVLTNERIINGFYQYERTDVQVVKLSTQDEIFMPMMVMALKKVGGTGSYVTIPYNNSINPDFNYRLLDPQDTFAVQEYMLVFKK